METMKAIRIHSYGGPDKLFLEEVPRPEPAAREVLIKVHAAGVNPIDWKVREGMLQHGYRTDCLSLRAGTCRG